MIKTIVADFSSQIEVTPEVLKERRERICDFEKALMGHKDAQFDTEINKQVTHHFATGVYGREMYIPQGQVIVSKIHKGKTLNIIAYGIISVISADGGFNTYEAPYVFVSPPMTKRIVIAHTDVMWVTAQGSHKTDVAELEEELIAKDFNLLDESKKGEDV